jgi:hypothetical protein
MGAPCVLMFPSGMQRWNELAYQHRSSQSLCPRQPVGGSRKSQVICQDTLCKEENPSPPRSPRWSKRVRCSLRDGHSTRDERAHDFHSTSRKTVALFRLGSSLLQNMSGNLAHATGKRIVGPVPHYATIVRQTIIIQP